MPPCARRNRSWPNPANGDVLIFMPGERDIRETGDLLEGRFSREAEIIPLFGMLSAA